MRALIQQARGYGLASAAALGVDMGLLLLLTSVGGWNPVFAAAISFIAGGVFLYVVSVRFVFDYRRIDNGVIELTSFVALGLVGLVINLIVIHAATDRLGLPLYLAKLGAAACTFSVSFLLRRQLLFTRSA